MKTPSVCQLCGKPATDTWSFYCAACLPVAYITHGNTEEAVRHHIPTAPREVLTRALDLETAKPFGSRKTLIAAILRRIRKLDAAATRTPPVGGAR